jgi:hypothetical protein
MPAKSKISRRTLLKRAAVAVALPPLEAMFNANGTAYAATASARRLGEVRPETRFMLWFNGNGVSERYWIPTTSGTDFELTPCLAPLAPFRKDIHVITGLDNPAARLPGPGNDHHRSMSALISGTSFTGRGAGGPSIDQVIADFDLLDDWEDRYRYVIELGRGLAPIPGSERTEANKVRG